MKEARSFSIYKEMEKLKNERDFFDKFNRLEQKCRLKDEYPSGNILLQLDLYYMVFEDTYGKTSKYCSIVRNTIDFIKKRKMEYSISIDGAGREEFIKMNLSPKETSSTEDLNKDWIDKIAEKLG
jgi:hypothetical protein